MKCYEQEENDLISVTASEQGRRFEVRLGASFTTMNPRQAEILLGKLCSALKVPSPTDIKEYAQKQVDEMEVDMVETWGEGWADNHEMDSEMAQSVDACEAAGSAYHDIISLFEKAAAK